MSSDEDDDVGATLHDQDSDSLALQKKNREIQSSEDEISLSD